MFRYIDVLLYLFDIQISLIKVQYEIYFEFIIELLVGYEVFLKKGLVYFMYGEERVVELMLMVIEIVIEKGLDS